MKQGRTLVDLATELERQSNAKRDFVADTRSLAVRPFCEDDKTNFPLVSSNLIMQINGEDMAVDRHSVRQIGGKLKIPAKYVDRLAQDHPDMLAYNINGLFSREPKRQMVRTLDGNVRAFLSDRYRPLDNYDLACAVIPHLRAFSAEITSCDVTSNKMYIKAVRPDLEVELPPPPGAQMGEGHQFFVEKVQAGITIGNSEIGMGRLSVQPAIFTKRCTNYAVFSDTSFFKVHLGKTLGGGSEADVWEFLSDATKEKSDAALWAQVNDLVEKAMDGTVFNRLVQNLSDARTDDIDTTADIPAVVEVTAKRFGLNQDEQAGVLQQLIRGGDLTRYGLHAAVTRHSHDVDSYDRASELEEAGGRIIELPRHQWAEIATAKAA